MKSFFWRLIFFLVLVVGAPASAGLLGGVPPSSAQCPYAGGGYADNCLTAPVGGSFLMANEMSGGGQQSGQTYSVGTHPQPHDLAGVDFAIAYYTPRASMKDPSLTQSGANGCGYNGSGPWMNCTGSGSLVINNFDFSLHNGIRLYIHGTYSSIDIYDNNFVNGTASEASSTNAIRVDDEGRVSDLNIHSNNFDGGMLSLPTSNAVAEIFDIRTTTGDTFEFKLNACWYFVAKCWESNANVLDIESNNYGYLDAVATGGFGQDGAHSENMLLGIVTMSHLTDKFNVSLQPRNMTLCGDPSPYTDCGGAVAFEFLSPGQPGLVVTQGDIEYNTLITNTDPSGTHSLISSMMEPDGTFTNLNFIGNYWDPTGARFCVNNENGNFTNPPVISGNINLLDGSAITFSQLDADCHGHGPG